MHGAGEIVVEILPRLESVLSDRWPVQVAPACDELLSSWLNRIAFAHGLSSRRFGQALGFEQRAWSAQLDEIAPGWLLHVLHARTGFPIDRIAAMTIAHEPWHPLALPMYWRPTRTRATWLQFCPSCLAEDEEPYFRRRWRRATYLICSVHNKGLIDRCPSCRIGIVSCDQRSTLPQHLCGECGYDLRRAKGVASSTNVRRSSRLIESLLAVEGKSGILGRSALISQILKLPSFQASSRDTRFNSLSSRARLRCLEMLRVDLNQHLMHDRDAEIAAWRRSIILSGGPFGSLAPLIGQLSNTLMMKTSPKNQRGTATRDLSFSHLISAYRDVVTRR